MMSTNKLEGFEKKIPKGVCLSCGEKTTELFRVLNGEINTFLKTEICRNPDCSLFIKMKAIRKSWRPKSNQEDESQVDKK